jgi:hypothetical protein
VFAIGDVRVRPTKMVAPAAGRGHNRELGWRAPCADGCAMTIVVAHVGVTAGNHDRSARINGDRR